MDYRSIIESKYNRSNWQGLLYDIFRQKVQFWQQPQSVPVDENMAKCALYIGKITLPDGHIIAIYEVELSDINKIIEIIKELDKRLELLDETKEDMNLQKGEYIPFKNLYKK